MATDQFREGYAPFKVPSIEEPCSTYYKIYGNLDAGSPPLIVLHGGPGSGHEYMLPFRDLWTRHQIPVIFYDEIGCAKSTHLRHTIGDQDFWKIDLFVAELENLVEHLGLQGKTYDVLGHSFGGIVAAKFASKRPECLRRLILYGASSDGELFFKGFWDRKREMSEGSQKAIDEAVENREFTGQPYLNAMAEMGRTFLCRARPWPPEELKDNFKWQADDVTCRRTMQGPSPFIYDGTLRHYSSIPILPQIAAPTLVINGEFDTTQYEPTVPFFDNIPKVRWITLAGASHMAHLDSPELREKTLKLVGQFLRPSEAGRV